MIAKVARALGNVEAWVFSFDTPDKAEADVELEKMKAFMRARGGQWSYGMAPPTAFHDSYTIYITIRDDAVAAQFRMFFA